MVKGEIIAVIQIKNRNNTGQPEKKGGVNFQAAFPCEVKTVRNWLPTVLAANTKFAAIIALTLPAILFAIHYLSLCLFGIYNSRQVFTPASLRLRLPAGQPEARAAAVRPVR